MDSELFFRAVEIGLQLVLVIFAWLALSAWKKEMRGKDKYKLAQDLLSYIKQLLFIVRTENDSLYPIRLNEILIDRDDFYKKRLKVIAQEKVLFDESIFGLFAKVDIIGDILLPPTIRLAMENITPSVMKRLDLKKSQCTYISLQGGDPFSISRLDESKDDGEAIYYRWDQENLTIQSYFEKWEKLMMELLKFR